MSSAWRKPSQLCQLQWKRRGWEPLTGRTFRATCCKHTYWNRWYHTAGGHKSHRSKTGIREAVPTGIAFRRERCSVSKFGNWSWNPSYHVQHFPPRHFRTVRWRRFHCTIYVQGLRDGSHKYLSASAKSIANFYKYLRNGHRSLPYLPEKLLSKAHQLSVFDKIGFTSWRFALRRLHEKRQNPSFFWRSRKWMHKKGYVGDIRLPGEHNFF